MESKTGMSEKSKSMALFCWTIRRYKSYIIAYWILLALTFPLVEILMMVQNILGAGDLNSYIHDINVNIENVPTTGFTMVAILYSTIISIMAFSYLHNKRSVDMFGGFPISRRRVFYTRYCAVLVSSIIPILAIGAIGAAMAGSKDAIEYIIRIIFILVISVIGNISFIAFVALCCGTVADIVVTYVAINIFSPICIILCERYAVAKVSGLANTYLPNTVYTMLSPGISAFAAFTGDGVDLYIAYWSLISIVLIAVCYVMSKKRKAEMAQNTFKFSAVEIIIKFLVCFTAGFVLGLILASFRSESIKSQIIWFAVGFVIADILAHTLLHLIFHRGNSRYKESLKECVVVFVTGMTFLFSVITGFFGYDSRVPDLKDIEYAAISINDYEEYYIDGEDILAELRSDAEYIKAVRIVQDSFVRDSQMAKNQGLYPIADDLIDITNAINKGSADVYSAKVVYKLKDGSTMTRHYDDSYGTVMAQNIILDQASNEYKLLKCMPKERIKMISLTVGEYADGTYGRVSVSRGEDYFFVDDIQKIVDSLVEDIEINGMPEYYGYPEVPGEVASLRLFYDEDDNGHEINLDIPIPSHYVNTIEAIEETPYIYAKMYECMTEEPMIKDIKKAGYKMNGNAIYFQVPSDWNEALEIRCVPFVSIYGDYLMSFEDELTICEKVEDGIYKYTLPQNENTDYPSKFKKVMFYQISSREIRTTEEVELIGNGLQKNLLKVKEKSFNEKWGDGYYKGKYESAWYEYEEK